MNIDKLVNEMNNYEYKSNVYNIDIQTDQINRQKEGFGKFLPFLFEKFENKEINTGKDEVINYLNSITKTYEHIRIDKLIIDIKNNTPFGRLLLFLIEKSKEGKFK